MWDCNLYYKMIEMVVFRERTFKECSLDSWRGIWLITDICPRIGCVVVFERWEMGKDFNMKTTCWNLMKGTRKACWNRVVICGRWERALWYHNLKFFKVSYIENWVLIIFIGITCWQNCKIVPSGITYWKFLPSGITSWKCFFRTFSNFQQI